MAESNPEPAFALGLTPPQREAFDAARRLLRERGDGLGWHHDLGTRLAVLAAGGVRGTARTAQLGRELGLSRVAVYQHLQFVERYPDREAAAALGEAGLRWAMAVALLAVADEADRLRLQSEAARQRWSVDRLRLELRKLRPYGTKRRSAPTSPSPAGGGVPAELGRLDDATEAWLMAHRDLLDAGEDAWARLGGAEGEEGTSVRQRLEALERALDQLAGDAVTLRRRLLGLLTGRPAG